MGEVALNVTKVVATFAAFAIVWSLRNAFIVGWNIHKFISDFETYKRINDKALDDIRSLGLERFKSIDARFDRAGSQMSDIASEVQGLPERMRTDFIPRREVELQFAENAVDRERIRQEIVNLWKRVNEREERSRRR